MTSFLGLNKRSRTSSSTDFSGMEIREYTDYIANYSKYLTRHYVKLAK